MLGIPTRLLPGCAVLKILVPFFNIPTALDCVCFLLFDARYERAP
jgi:hypothetical protein